ncbi:MAG: hypothetical protein KAX54_00250 [Thauera sp.]|nr:hypothetical protein [Thauera sp.]
MTLDPTERLEQRIKALEDRGRMTPDENRRLVHVETTLVEVEKKVSQIYDAFLEPGADGSPSLKDRVCRIVIAAERGEWAAIVGFRGLLALSALLAALAAIKAGMIGALFGGGK